MNLLVPLQAGLAELGCTLEAATQDRLLAYLALLSKWNRVYNLTAVHDTRRMLTQHLFDSLAVLPYIDANSLLDVGSGAGLPGIPLAVARPSLAVTLLEASQKKAAFLQQAVIELGLDNVTVVQGRAQDYHPARLFPCIISRALTELDNFARMTQHLLAAGGRWLAMKGKYPQAELAHLTAAAVVRTVRLNVPGLKAERHLVIMERHA